MPVEEKFKEVHVDLQKFYDLPLIFRSVYVAILIYEKTQKLWVLYP